MIDHLSSAVSDIRAARSFYDAVLATLGAARLMDFDVEGAHGSGWGREGKPSFWVTQRDGAAPGPRGGHVAFAAPSRAAVDAFYEAALAAGAGDNGAPGLRLDYHPNYYASFVVDADGNRLEAVCHQAE